MILTSPSTDVNFIASQALARSQQRPQEDEDANAANDDNEGTDAMEALERQARAPIGFVAASTGPQAGNLPPQQPVVATNPDALEIEMDDE